MPTVGVPQRPVLLEQLQVAEIEPAGIEAEDMVTGLNREI